MEAATLDKTGDQLINETKKILGMLAMAEEQKQLGGTMDPGNLALLCKLTSRIDKEAHQLAGLIPVVTVAQAMAASPPPPAAAKVPVSERRDPVREPEDAPGDLIE